MPEATEGCWDPVEFELPSDAPAEDLAGLTTDVARPARDGGHLLDLEFWVTPKNTLKTRSQPNETG